MDVTPPKGTIYIWAPVPEGHDSASYCELVLEESGVVVSPGGAYGPNGEGFFRISLTVPDERLTEAVERLRSSLVGLSACATAASVGRGRTLHLCALAEVRTEEPPVRLEALFYEPGTRRAGGRARSARSARRSWRSRRR